MKIGTKCDTRKMKTIFKMWLYKSVMEVRWTSQVSNGKVLKRVRNGKGTILAIEKARSSLIKHIQT